jgi:hypothetical protein
MIKLEDKPNVQAPDATYPFGKSTDNTGSNNGLPLNSATLEDYHQFFAKLFNQSGLVSNGLPDNAVNGFQMMEALMAVMPKKFVKESTTILDDDVKTITRAEIEAAFGVYNPFYNAFTAGTPNPLVDFQIQVWILNSPNDWRLLSAPIAGSPGAVYAKINGVGDIELRLYGAPYGSPVPIRIVLIG